MAKRSHLRSSTLICTVIPEKLNLAKPMTLSCIYISVEICLISCKACSFVNIGLKTKWTVLYSSPIKIWIFFPRFILWTLSFPAWMLLRNYYFQINGHLQDSNIKILPLEHSVGKLKFIVPQILTADIIIIRYSSPILRRCFLSWVQTRIPRDISRSITCTDCTLRLLPML